MTKEIYDKLVKMDYSRVQNQIKSLLKKYNPYDKGKKNNEISEEPLYCDVMGIASIIFMMMIDETISDFNQFEIAFEQNVSNALGLHGVCMRQESIGIYLEALSKEQRKGLFAELRTMANDMQYEELVAYILFGDITEEDDLTCIKTPLAIGQLASDLLDISVDDCVVDFSMGEKNFIPDGWFRNTEAEYKFFNMGEETFNVFHYLRCALLGINVSNDITYSMYDEEAEEILYDKAFFDYCTGGYEGRVEYPFDFTGGNKEWRFAYRVMQLLKKDGKAVIIVPNVCATTQKDIRAREWFLSQGYIEAVIALPEKMYKGTNAAFTMILLSHDNDKVTFIDATDKGQLIRNGAKRMNSFSEEDIDEIVASVKGKTSFGTEVLLENIFKNDSILSPVLYCLKTSSIEGIGFQEVIRNITRGVQIPGNELDQLISEEPTSYKYLTPANILNGVIQDNLPFLKTVEEKQKKYIANKGDIVICKNAEPFKVALVEEDNLLVSSNLYKVEINTAKINSIYLKGYLESEVGQAELKKASSGGITTTLGVDALKKIQISCPMLKEQEKVVKEYKFFSDEICKKEKELEELLVMRKSLFK